MARKLKLTQAEWVEIGKKIKAAEILIHEAAALAGTKQRGRTILAAATAISHGKCKLDQVVCTQHPDWRDATKVFYGPTEPKIDSE